MISTKTAQKRLTILWFVIVTILFVIVILRTSGGIYQDHVDDVWNWFLPNVVPLLSLMLSVVVIEFTQHGRAKAQSDKFLYILAFWSSFIYLMFVGFTALNLVVHYSNPIDNMKASKNWLVPLQSFTSVTLGAFFVKRHNLR